MTPVGGTCRRGATLAEAASIMARRDCDCVPVVDDEDRLIGVITDRDICLGALAERAALEEGSVAVHMATPGHRCSPHQTITSAARTMRALGVSGLVVADDADRVVGILSLEHLLFGVLSTDSGGRDVHELLAVLGAPRRRDGVPKARRAP